MNCDRCGLERETYGHDLPDQFICGPCYFKEYEERIAEVEAENTKLRTDIDFMGGSYNKKGELEIKMEKWHKFQKSQNETIAKLREGLKRLQFIHAGYCLSDENHPIAGGPEHYEVCIGCRHYHCEGCEPNCWLAALIGEGKP
jgi:hypothetical protein